jgi:hypothetical protein
MSVPPPHPPFKISRVLAVYCLFRGMEAADAGQPITACPYLDGTDDLTSFYAGHWWRKGYNRNAPVTPRFDTDAQ